MVVQPVMTRVAEQSQIVNVGGAFGGFAPRHDVVSLTPGRLGRAEHATAVTNNQGATLGVRGGALATAMPERLAVTREQQPEQLGVAGQALQFGLWNRADPGDLAPPLRILPRHHVGRSHNDNLMTGRERSRRAIATPRHRYPLIAATQARLITGHSAAGTATRLPHSFPTGGLTVAPAGPPRPTGAGRSLTATPNPAGWRRVGRTGMEADGDSEGVEAALFDAAGIGVLSPALGTPDAIGNAVDERAELGTEHPVEGGVRHEHAVVAVTEVQAAPPALAQVLLVQVGGILVALRPVLYVPARTVGGHSGHLRQQLCIAVHGLGAGRPGGAGQSIGVLRRDVTLRQRAGDLRHLGQRAGPLPSSPRLAM